MQTEIEIIKKEDKNANFIKKFIEKLTLLEFTYFIGFSKYEHIKTKNKNKPKNYRNGFLTKRVSTFCGDLYVLIPRDRFAKFSSNIIKKYESKISIDEKRIILFKDQNNIDLSSLGELIRELTKIHDQQTLIDMTYQMRDLITSLPK